MKRRVYVSIVISGSSCFAGPRDSETSYVRQFLAFLGIADVEFVYAEGLAISESSKQASLAKAANSIARLNGTERLAA